jgi:hypothetical protein
MPTICACSSSVTATAARDASSGAASARSALPSFVRPSYCQTMNSGPVPSACWCAAVPRFMAFVGLLFARRSIALAGTCSVRSRAKVLDSEPPGTGSAR